MTDGKTGGIQLLQLQSCKDAADFKPLQQSGFFHKMLLTAKLMLMRRLVASPKLKQLLQKMLMHNPIERMTLEEVCEHAWLSKVSRPRNPRTVARSCMVTDIHARRLTCQEGHLLRHCLPCQRLD